jgi:hypothetical protein
MRPDYGVRDYLYVPKDWGALDCVGMLALSGGLFALAWWLLPEGFFSTPLVALTLGSILYALGALGVAVVAALVLFFTVAITYRAIKKA